LARVIGRLSAIGTVGSIVGTIATSSLLVPAFGTSAIMGGIAVALIALSFYVATDAYLAERIGLAIAVLGASALIASGVNAQSLVADVDTLYSRVWVYERIDPVSQMVTRMIHTDPFGTQCASYIKKDGTVTDDLVFGYTKSFDTALKLSPDATTALVIGGCNYSYPRHLLSVMPGMQIDVVEIDPGMTEVARDYFDLKDNDRLSIFHEDARMFLNRSDETYDLVFTDAFNSNSSIPFQLATREAMQRISDILSDDGIVALNVIGGLEGDTSGFTLAEIGTIRDVFPHVRLFQVYPGPGDRPQNLLVLASKSDAKINDDLGPLTDAPALEIDIATIGSGDILTDDHAPVEWLGKGVRSYVLENRR
jgi:predicted membrane-bound spermidine synthase